VKTGEELRQEERAALLRAVDDSRRLFNIDAGLIYVRIESSEYQTLLQAARDKLAEQEAKPNRATLKELVEVCKAAANVLGGSQSAYLREAADILRALDEKVVPDLRNGHELPRHPGATYWDACFSCRNLRALGELP